MLADRSCIPHHPEVRDVSRLGAHVGRVSNRQRGRYRLAGNAPRRRCATFPKCIAPAARENSSEGGIPVKAVRTHGRGGPEQLFFEDAPAPVVRPGDVLVRVRATGITPAN